MNKAYETVEEYFRPEDVHERDRISKGGEILALFIAVIWTVLHGLNIYMVLWDKMSFALGAAIHLLLSAVVIIGTWIMRKAGLDIRYLYILCISSFAGGVFGALGTVISTLLSLYYNLVSQPFSEWYQTIFPQADISNEEAMYELITTGKDEGAKSYGVVPFLDIMTLGTEAQKRRALSRMTDHFNPSFATAYRKALTDKSNAIRVQAASSVAKIENQFTHMLMDIEKLEAKHPKDPKIKLGLARYYDSYAFTGLLDDSREAENQTKALDKYREYLEFMPDDIDARIEAGRLLIRSGEYEQVIKLFNDCIDAGYSNDTLKLWMIEALFEAGRYEELRRVAPECKELLDDIKNVRPRLAKAIEYWGEET